MKADSLEQLHVGKTHLRPILAWLKLSCAKSELSILEVFNRLALHQLFTGDICSGSHWYNLAVTLSSWWICTNLHHSINDTVKVRDSYLLCVYITKTEQRAKLRRTKLNNFLWVMEIFPSESHVYLDIFPFSLVEVLKCSFRNPRGQAKPLLNLPH